MKIAASSERADSCFPLDELARLTLRAHPDGRHVTVDEEAGLFAQAPKNAIVASPDARLGTASYEQWLQDQRDA